MPPFSRRELLRRSVLLGAFWPLMTSAQSQNAPSYGRERLPAGKIPNRPYTPSPEDFGWLLEDVWPPLYFGNEITDEARRKIDGQEWARKLFGTLREEAELVLKLPPQLPQERAGWRHDFYGRQQRRAAFFRAGTKHKFSRPDYQKTRKQRRRASRVGFVGP